MERSMTRGEQNLLMLESIIPRGEKLYVWCFDEAGEQIATSCPEEDEALLARVEGAETALFALGFTDFRVRLFHGAARLQLPAAQMAGAIDRRGAIREALAPYFETVLLDLKDR